MDIVIDDIVSSGTKAIDSLLDGGYEQSTITTIYGPAGSGKTNLMLVFLCALVKKGKKLIYIDTEGSFSVARVKQLLPDFEKYAEQIIYLRPFSFEEQKKAILQTRALIEHNPDKFSAIIVDSIAMLYRLENAKTLDVPFVNKELSTQLGILNELAGKYGLPILLANQVYADFENKDAVKMVGGDLLKYTSKCLIELKKAHKGLRVATLMKHRSIPEGREVAFKIIGDGIEEKEMQSVADRLKKEIVNE
jgi:DNA repair protein RadB